MPKERSGRPRLDRSCNWEKYGYDNLRDTDSPHYPYHTKSRLSLCEE